MARGKGRNGNKRKGKTWVDRGRKGGERQEKEGRKQKKEGEKKEDGWADEKTWKGG